MNRTPHPGPTPSRDNPQPILENSRATIPSRSPSQGASIASTSATSARSASVRWITPGSSGACRGKAPVPAPTAAGRDRSSVVSRAICHQSSRGRSVSRSAPGDKQPPPPGRQMSWFCGRITRSRTVALAGRVSMKITASATSSERRPLRAATSASMAAGSVIAPERVQDHAGRDGADADVVGRHLAAQAVDERLDRVLRGRIDRLPLDRLVPGDRGGDDDVAGLRRDHPGQDRVNDAEDRVDVDGEELVPGVRVAVGDVAGDVEPGIGEEDVDAAEGVARPRDDRSISAGRVRSAGSDEACRPPASPATSASRSRERPTRATRTPSAARASAVARPMPELAPVTRAVLPVRGWLGTVSLRSSASPPRRGWSRRSGARRP